MILSLIAAITFLVVQVTEQDIDNALAARQTSEVGGITYHFCEAEATPLSFALHRAGYATNVVADEVALVARTHDEEPTPYELTGYGFWQIERVCNHGLRVEPYTAVLVYGEAQP